MVLGTTGTCFELVDADAHVEEDEHDKVANDHGPAPTLMIQLHHVVKLEIKRAYLDKPSSHTHQIQLL